MPQEGPKIIGVDLSDPWAALIQLKDAPEEELTQILVSLARTTRNIEILGMGLVQELQRRMVQGGVMGTVQAGAGFKDVSEAELARMPVTSEGN